MLLKSIVNIGPFLYQMNFIYLRKVVDKK